MQSDIDRILIPRAEIDRRVREVAGQIIADLHAHDAGGQFQGELILVPILTGSFMFVADLIRDLPLRLRIRLVSVSSYPGTATTSQGVSLQAALTDLPEDLAQAHVLIIDDILDSGRTLALVRELLAQRRPASLRTCVLLRKQHAHAVHAAADYVCFEIPDEFVVGYGLDFDGYYRNLPDIVTLRPDIIRS